MSITARTPSSRRTQNNFIEWDTVRGRGNFDDGYMNEFFIFQKENGEIDEEKLKQTKERTQKKIIRKHRSCSIHSKPNSNPCNSNIKTFRKVRNINSCKLNKNIV